MTQPSLIDRMAQALRRLDAGFCDISPSSNFSQRHEFRLALIQAREVVAEYEASQKAGGCARVEIGDRGQLCFERRNLTASELSALERIERLMKSLPAAPASIGDDTDHKEPT